MAHRREIAQAGDRHDRHSVQHPAGDVATKAAVLDACSARSGHPSADRVAPAHLRAALDALKLGVVTYDKDFRIQFCSRALADMLDIPVAVVDRATSLVELLEGSRALNLEMIQRVHEACLDSVGRASDSMIALPAEVSPEARSLTLTIVQLGDGHWMASFEDVTARHSAELSAVEHAMHDPLTGLPNRQLFESRVGGALASLPLASLPLASLPLESESLALMFIDLDRFKAVNDTLGHPIGDSLLRLVAKRLRTMLRPADVMARLGGDEFAVLVMPSPGRIALAQLTRRIVGVLGRPYLVDGHLINIGTSIGVAFCPEDGQTYEQLMRNADLALYHAKKTGRGRFSFFEAEMDARALARRDLEIDLRKAFVLDEFELHYQAQVDLEANKVVGFEALLRWQHPERGLVSPATFIPLAEEIGLIGQLGEWVLNEACRTAMRWPSPIVVAVNVSSQQFSNSANLVGAVEKALQLSGLPGSRLEIEITESALLKNGTAVLEALRRVRSMGVRVAMDDFGTGYSSLSQLHSFPFDKIKIDQSFVRGGGDIQGQNAIIRAITALGGSLGMKTIAEGVETLDQLGRIRTEGCNFVQGYLFSRPVPEGEIDALIASFASDLPAASPASEDAR